jgi:glucose/arabinose dehydrogenase
MFRTAIDTALIAPLLVALPAAAQEVIETDEVPIQVETFASGLDHPWGMAFLPEGGMLVTERSGALRHVTAGGEISDPIAGVPDVVARGQGGLLDVTLHPGFADNRLVYWSYAEAGDGGTNGTAIARGRIDAGMTSLGDVEVIFRQQPKVRSNNHFGSRLAFDRDGDLFATLGERSSPRFRVLAQDLGTHLGKVIRIRDDGSAPPDNPFVGQAGAMPEIWSTAIATPRAWRSTR